MILHMLYDKLLLSVELSTVEMCWDGKNGE